MSERSLILDTVQQYRNEGVIDRNKLEWGRWALSIPHEDFAILCRINPDLNSRDAATRTAAMKKFIASPESLPYRVMERAG
jgi:hypothetical protein